MTSCAKTCNSASGGGSGISLVGNNVYGTEGSGTVEFVGTTTSLSWTNPTFEDGYGFHVGISAAAVPEPGSMSLTLLGLAFRRNAR